MKEVITWKYLKRPISEDDIKSLENELGYKFPNKYVEIQLDFHGARPSKRMFNTKITKGRMIKTFLPITEGISLLKVKHLLELPNILVPFANTPSGDYICFEYFSQDSNPAIVLWNHERRTKEYIGITFEIFMNSLY